MILGVIGPWQIILLASIPVLIFAIGYYIGNKNGQLKARKELEKKNN